jgi:hypothetical protein
MREPEFKKPALTGVQRFFEEEITPRVNEKYDLDLLTTREKRKRQDDGIHEEKDPWLDAGVGDLARMTRIPGAFNPSFSPRKFFCEQCRKWYGRKTAICNECGSRCALKIQHKTRNTYVICLSERYFNRNGDLGKFILKQSVGKRIYNGNPWAGSIPFDPAEFDIEDPEDFMGPAFEGEILSEAETVDVPSIFPLPPCLRHWTRYPWLDHDRRFWFLLALRDLGWAENQVRKFFRSFLHPEKFTHVDAKAPYGENMIHRVFSGNQRRILFGLDCGQMAGGWSICDRENCNLDHPVYL